MGEDAWLEAAYEDRCSGYVDRSEDEDRDGEDPCAAGDHLLDDEWQCTDCGADLSA